MLFAVYDGHNGEAAVDFVREKLPLNICKEPHYLTHGQSGSGDSAAIATAVALFAVGIVVSHESAALLVPIPVAVDPPPPCLRVRVAYDDVLVHL